MKRYVVPAIATAIVVVLSGCSSDTVAVRGTAARDGQALTDGRIVLTPIGGGKVASGEIESDGTFQLTTDRTNDGAIPGTYRITIIQSMISESGKQFTAYLAPSNQSWEVKQDGSNVLAVNILAQEGWQARHDD